MGLAQPRPTDSVEPHPRRHQRCCRPRTCPESYRGLLRHAAISAAAMKKGKHVFCQKPLTQTIHEAQRIAEIARETRVATQIAVGNQASEDTRLLCEWIWAGAIGPVREVHNWSTRPFWPQGLDRPKEAESAPAGLDWDLWLGPAPVRPYNHV